MKKLRVHLSLEQSSKSSGFMFPVGLLNSSVWAQRIVRFGLILFVLQASIFVFHDLALKFAVSQRHSLHKELQKVDADLSDFRANIRTTYNNEDLLHVKFGVAPPDKAMRELGTGGDIHPDSLFLSSMHPVKGLSNQVLVKMDNIEAQLSRNQQSYTQMKNYMEQKFTQWRHIPSISPTSGRFSSAFGIRTHPVTGEKEKMHNGIDVSNSRWTPIYAAADGIVDLVKFGEFFGNYVVVNHGNGYITKYGHMEKPIVKAGQFVERYQVIGYMGRTGRTTGIHLHYEVHYNNSPINPIAFVLPSEYSVD